MSRLAVLELLTALTGAVLGELLNKRGYRLLGSISWVLSIVIAFFSFRGAIKDFLEIALKYYTETAVVLTLMTVVLFWIGTQTSKPNSSAVPADLATPEPAPTAGWAANLKSTLSETATQLTSILDHHSRALRILIIASLVLLVIPVAFSLRTLFSPESQDVDGSSAAPTSPRGSTTLGRKVEDDAAVVTGRQGEAEEAARWREAEAARQKQADDERRRLAEAERQRKADEDRRVAEAVQRARDQETAKAKEEEAARQREAERRLQEQESTQRAQEAEAQARADRERQKKLAAIPKSVDPLPAMLNGFKLFPGTFMWGIGPPPDQRMSYTARSVEECSNICRRNPHCIGFSHESVSCFTFGRISEVKTGTHYTSGRR